MEPNHYHNMTQSNHMLLSGEFSNVPIHPRDLNKMSKGSINGFRMSSVNDKPIPYNSYARASMQSNDSFRASHEFGNLGHGGFIFGNNVLSGSN
jgi:hypothetical protein